MKFSILSDKARKDILHGDMSSWPVWPLTPTADALGRNVSFQGLLRVWVSVCFGTAAAI